MGINGCWLCSLRSPHHPPWPYGPPPPCTRSPPPSWPVNQRLIHSEVRTFKSYNETNYFNIVTLASISVPSTSSHWTLICRLSHYCQSAIICSRILLIQLLLLHGPPASSLGDKPSSIFHHICQCLVALTHPTPAVPFSLSAIFICGWLLLFFPNQRNLPSIQQYIIKPDYARLLLWTHHRKYSPHVSAIWFVEH